MWPAWSDCLRRRSSLLLGSDLSGLSAMSSLAVMIMICSDKGGASIPDHRPLNWAGNAKSEWASTP
jgi:hypothetical protein